MIEHDNILYIRDLSEIGGVETYIWEMAKKYQDLDIAVVYKTAHYTQLARLNNLCRTYQHTNQKIKCKVAIINYDTSIIDYIDSSIYRENAKANEGIYQVVHGDYENAAYSWKPPTDSRIKMYIGVTKYICESFKRITNLENVTYGYNPLTIEEKPKPIILLSATRLSAIKGKDRMIKLANALDQASIDYTWLVFTNDVNAIPSPNVMYMKPTLDIGKWYDLADYLVQLSDTEACSYSINEMLYRNKPVIVTPLPYLKEIGVKDKVNSYIMEFDCSNIDEIVKNIRNIPKFEFKKLPDNYSDILIPGKSKYKVDLKTIVEVKCIVPYPDIETNQYKNINDTWKTNKVRAEYLESHGVVKIIGGINGKENIS